MKFYALLLIEIGLTDSRIAVDGIIRDVIPSAYLPTDLGDTGYVMLEVA